MAEGETVNTTGMPLVLDGGTCIFCGKGKADVLNGLQSYHTECIRCPECGDDAMVFWKTEKPHVARCLNCLKRWVLLKG